MELDAGRGSGGFGPAGLSWADLAAWAALTGTRPQPWELDALRALDQAWLAEMAARLEAGKSKA